MTWHGIHTTKASVWFHLFPLDSKLFWYGVADMLEYIALTKPQQKIGRSKNGAATGEGYLVSKSAFIVSRADVPRAFLDWHDWTNGTDRENGRRGQLVVNVLLRRHLSFPTWRSERIETNAAQNGGYDGFARPISEFKWEAKTECVQSDFLFVQTSESGHQPNLTRNGETRESELAPFDQG